MPFRVRVTLEGRPMSVYTETLNELRNRLPTESLERIFEPDDGVQFIPESSGIAQVEFRAGGGDHTGRRGIVGPWDFIRGETELANTDIAIFDVDKERPGQQFLFSVDHIPAAIEREQLRFGRGSRRFREEVGMVKDVRRYLKENREVIGPFMDKLCFVSPTLDTPATAEGTLDMYSEMSCVFLGLSLMFGKGPFLNELRSHLGISSEGSFCQLPKDYTSCREIIALTAKGSPFKDRRRANTLVPFLVERLNRRFNTSLTHASSLEAEHIAHIALLLNVNIHLLQEETYKRVNMVIHGLKNRRISGLVGSKKGEYGDVLRLLLKKNVPLYTSYLGAVGSDFRTMRSTQLKVTDLLFLVSNIHGEHMHIEPEFRVEQTMTFAAHVLFTGFHVAVDTRYRIEEDGEFKMSPGNPIWSGPLNKLMSSEMVMAEPFYFRLKLNVHPEDQKLEPVVITTSEELNTFLEDMKQFAILVDRGVLDPGETRPFGAIDVHISADAYYPGTKEEYLILRATEIEPASADEPTYEYCLNGKYFCLADVLDEIVCSIRQGKLPSTFVPSDGVVPEVRKSLEHRTSKNISKDIENQTELNELVKKGATEEEIERARQCQTGPTPSPTFMNVGVREFDVAFDSAAFGTMAVLNVSVYTPPDDTFADALLKYHESCPLPLIEALERDRTQAIKDMHTLRTKLKKNEKINGPRIIKIDKKIEMAENNKTFTRDALSRMNKVAYMVNETILSAEQLIGSSRYMKGVKSQKGSSIMRRVATVYAPDQEVGMFSSATEWNDFIPICTTSRDYIPGTSITKFDFKRQYTSIAQGGGNLAFDLDRYGIDPHHLVPRNPHLQNLYGRPLLSYFIDCGLVNIDPSVVDIELFRKMTPSMFRSCHNLYLIIQAGSTKVVDSVSLIQWTTDFCNENKDKGKSFVELATLFQFDILKLKTARFGFDANSRSALHSVLAKKYKEFTEQTIFDGEMIYFGHKFIQDCLEGEFSIEVKEQLRERLIVPCRHKIIERVDGMLCFTPDWTHTEYAKESCRIFLLHAQVFDHLQKTIGLVLNNGKVVDRTMVKTWCNLYVGKLRQNRRLGWETKRETDSVPFSEDPSVHIRSEKFNPNVSVYHSTLPRAQEEFVHLISAKMRPVRGHYDAFRSYIVRTGARMVEVALMGIPTEDTVLFTRTDGVAVQRQHAAVVEEGMKKVTYTIDESMDPSYSVVPGELVGYTREDFSFEQMQTDKQCKKFILEKVHREMLVEGLMGGLPTVQKAPSSVKTALDCMDNDITLYADEEMFTFYQTYERKHWMDPMMAEVDVGTPKQFALYVSSQLDPRTPGEFDLFSELFTAHLADRIDEYKKVVLKGPPGVGKSYLAKTYAKRIKAKYPNEITISAVPFHMLRKTYEGIFDWCKTYQSLFGTGINAEDAKYDPYHYYNRVDRPYVLDKPAEHPISLLVLDEYQSFSVQTAEIVKIICNQARCVLICGDDHQQPNIGHTGMCLTGSIARTITNGVTIDMNIEYRNPCPLYIASRLLTRQGQVQQYLSSDICDYFGIGLSDGKEALREEIRLIASETAKYGFPNTVIACQNWDIAGMIVLQAVRAMLVLGVSSEYTLIHLGRTSTCEERDDDTNVQLHSDGLFGSKQNAMVRGRRRSDAHKQGVHGMPLLFFPGIIYIVVKTFSTHLTSEEPPRQKMYQTTLLSYVRSEIKVVRYPSDNGKVDNVRYYIFRVADPQTKEPSGPEIALSSYETASYLLYPFITQQASMIGLTLERVTILQISNRYTSKNTGEQCYTRSYEPLAVRLKQSEETYGASAQYVRQCRQLQVALTRVPKGQKTKVIEIDSGSIYFAKINLYCLLGRSCNRLCSLYDNYWEVGRVDYGFKFAIRQRGKLCKEVQKAVTSPFIPRLEFPKDKLVVSPTLTLTDILLHWFTDKKRTRET